MRGPTSGVKGGGFGGISGGRTLSLVGFGRIGRVTEMAASDERAFFDRTQTDVIRQVGAKPAYLDGCWPVRLRVAALPAHGNDRHLINASWPQLRRPRSTRRAARG